MPKKTFDKNMKICIQNSTLSWEETVKLLGIEIDYQLNIDIHIKVETQDWPVGYPFLDVRPTAQDTINFNLLFAIW
jgi:hypothetical protein